MDNQNIIEELELIADTADSIKDVLKKRPDTAELETLLSDFFEQPESQMLHKLNRFLRSKIKGTEEDRICEILDATYEMLKTQIQ